MVDMEERELFPAFLSDDENRVEKIENLGEIEHVQNERDGRIFKIKGVARKQRIPCSISSHPGLNAHVGAEHDLHHVVGELEGVEKGNRRQERHECASQEDEEQVGGGDGGGRGERGQRPLRGGRLGPALGSTPLDDRSADCVQRLGDAHGRIGGDLRSRLLGRARARADCLLGYERASGGGVLESRVHPSTLTAASRASSLRVEQTK